MHTVAVTLASMPLFVRGDMRVDSAVLCAGNSNIK